jgi:hypothetical protein
MHVSELADMPHVVNLCRFPRLLAEPCQEKVYEERQRRENARNSSTKAKQKESTVARAITCIRTSTRTRYHYPGDERERLNAVIAPSLGAIGARIA